MERKLIYRFRPGQAEGRTAWSALLGGKGANLAEMANLGIPVPPGFTVTTECCVDYMSTGKLPERLVSAVREGMRWIEEQTGRGFGNPENPLLVSVRSGARSSMPGMMDTVLDLGLNEETVRGLALRSGSERFALDAYRRLLQMFGDVVLDVEHTRFEQALTDARRALAEQKGVGAARDADALARLVPDSALGAVELRKVVAAYQKIILDRSGKPFPSDPEQQLLAAIEAVFRSWNNPRAKLYRRINSIPDEWGTAVNVQAMVFGNLGDKSATGVAFTRDPSTGEKRFFGEWLPNAQGEDVVAGVRTPLPLSKSEESGGRSLQEAMPERYAELSSSQQLLEHHFRDMQDLEFTIEGDRLYLLQTRSGKRTARAAVRIAVEMVEEGLLHPDEAILRVDAQRLSELLFPALDPKCASRAIARGIPASPGAVSGKAVFTAEDAAVLAARKEEVILVRQETSPEDLHGMEVAKGIVTARGGATSHAAVVARGMGRPCVAGCSSLHVEEGSAIAHAYGPNGDVVATFRHGDEITIDGASGEVHLGRVATLPATLGAHFETLLTWTDRVSRMRVRANADTPAQARQARRLGARGIGLCRTEHMFFDEERILAVREMILAPDAGARARALEKLLPFQRKDFEGLFEAMDGLPVNIRLLDPPLHEFLPRDKRQVAELAADTGVSVVDVERRVAELHEFNPMLGHRGVRLGVTFPEISEMQVRAILEAACEVQAKGVEVFPEIMVPLSLCPEELARMRAIVDRVAEAVFAHYGRKVAFKVGSMIEVPRAALLADQLAQHCQFYSFGTNDLTQTTLALSRDDAGSFLPTYVAEGLLPDDPFVSLDREGVGELMRIAVEKARVQRPDISLGVCGEHGGDPKSIEFCEQLGLLYVSCSPFRVPVARVAAAQAALRRTGKYWH